MNWTTEQPKEPGFYWFKPWDGVTIIRVREDRAVQFIGDDEVYHSALPPGEYSGPIEPPAEHSNN